MASSPHGTGSLDLVPRWVALGMLVVAGVAWLVEGHRAANEMTPAAKAALDKWEAGFDRDVGPPTDSTVLRERTVRAKTWLALIALLVGIGGLWMWVWLNPRESLAVKKTLIHNELEQVRGARATASVARSWQPPQVTAEEYLNAPAGGGRAVNLKGEVKKDLLDTLEYQPPATPQPQVEVRRALPVR